LNTLHSILIVASEREKTARLIYPILLGILVETDVKNVMNISQNKIQQIYCDESGFTGNNLLDRRDPFFAYATVAVCHEEAKEFTEKIIRDHKLQGGELKFGNLIRHNTGRKVILQVIEKFSPSAKVAINDKKYNLGCKFYEYIFDPIIKGKNSIFYEIGFHKFISNVLYLHFQAKSDFAEEIFDDFYTLMMSGDNENLTYLFGSLDLEDLSPPIDMIRRFCIAHKDSICERLIALKNNGSDTWILDLTSSALFALLVEWGQEFDRLEVFCDKSKPLQQQDEIFQVMVGREGKMFSKQHASSFNLVNSPEYVDSKTFPGVQIADIFAGAFTYMFREELGGRHQDYFDKWKPHLLGKCFSPHSVIPDDQCVDLEDVSVRRNYSILEELARRSTLNIPLLDGFYDSMPSHDIHSEFSDFLFGPVRFHT
jgi:hypothetical protein